VAARYHGRIESMSRDQTVFVAAAFLVLILVTLGAHFRWLRSGRAGTTVCFAAGVSVIVALRIAGMPPVWFEGSGAGFGIALSFLAGAFVARGQEGGWFGVPLFLGLGLALGVVNAVAWGSSRL
jgi:hypothetical protein